MSNPAMFFVGGSANGQFLRPNRNDWRVNKPFPMARCIRDYAEPIAPIETTSEHYTRRRWCHSSGEMFDYFAPMEWGQDKIIDHITGGSYGTTRLADTQARGRSGPSPDSGNAGRYTTEAHNPYSNLTEPVAIEDAGIRTGEIVGWRVWELCVDRHVGAFLQSTFTSHDWIPGVPMAGNVSGPHGVHAWHHPLSALAYMAAHIGDSLDRGYPPLAYVLGSVDLWGTVIEHEFGWRAQKAQIASLDTVWPIAKAPLHESEWERLRGLLGYLRVMHEVNQLKRETPCSTASR